MSESVDTLEAWLGTATDKLTQTGKERSGDGAFGLRTSWFSKAVLLPPLRGAQSGVAATLCHRTPKR